ncbi:MAG: hypothetical protein IKW90_12510 [Lachnospiraceae bacterium]|nr:hypothetical protein [Lachnospiraceae bacterium]
MIKGLEELWSASEENRSAGVEERIKQLQDMRKTFLYRRKMQRIAWRLDSLIRCAYRSRNPFRDDNPDNINAQGFLFSGVYGIGKRTLMRKLVSLYPDVIFHHEYDGKLFYSMQIPVLYAKMPQDVSVSGLCRQLLGVLREKSGEQGKNVGQGKNGEMGKTGRIGSFNIHYDKGSSVIDILFGVLRELNVGCIVLETLEDSDLTGKDSERVFRLLQGIIREAGVSVCIICGEKLAEAVSNTPGRAMVFSSANDLIYTPYSQDDEWERFIDVLWSEQLVKQPPKKSIELDNVLFEWSRGIAEIVVRILIEVQENALDRGTETWGKKELDIAARTALKTVLSFLGSIDPVLPQDLASVMDGMV